MADDIAEGFDAVLSDLLPDLDAHSHAEVRAALLRVARGRRDAVVEAAAALVTDYREIGCVEQPLLDTLVAAVEAAASDVPAGPAPDKEGERDG